jgi:predicted 3-demethylubiquinone-9 3-methyltransferase (glyoxalase superfamily)
MDSARTHDFGFNEAVSLLLPCEDQKEIDELWQKLSFDPKSGQCGWLKDKFGVSWQVSAVAIGKMLGSGDREKIDRMTRAFLPMKKFDLAKLEKVFRGEPAA